MSDPTDLLLPCPFCGSEAEFDRIASPQADLYGVCVRCASCGAHVRTKSSVDESDATGAAIIAWNRRNADPTDLIRRLADEVEADVRHTYGIQHSHTRENVHPAQRRRYDRDIAIVHEARRWIREHGGEHG